MGETKWTRGPWSVGASPARRPHDFPIDARGVWLELATVYGRTPDDDMPDGRWNAEGRANADLIAAAPDLYEALEALLGAHIYSDGEGICFVRDVDAADRARAALAKARGEP